jgi:hypothetical protein
LSNLQAEKEPLLQVILVGQTALQDRLRHPSLRQLAQRVSVHYHLTPLDRKEAREYIIYRLARAGGSGIFTDSALDKLYDLTKGVPRRLNTWCDLGLVAGFAEGRREIDGEFLDTVIAAQGVGLETQEPSAAAEPAPRAEDHKAAEVRHPAPDDGVGLAVAEQSSRLSRLEGLVLELSGQMLPVLRQLLGKPDPPDPETLLAAGSPTPFPADEESEAAEATPSAGGPYPSGATGAAPNMDTAQASGAAGTVGASDASDAAGGSETAGATPPKPQSPLRSWWSKIRGR